MADIDERNKNGLSVHFTPSVMCPLLGSELLMGSASLSD